jgi:hypothetical protein
MFYLFTIREQSRSTAVSKDSSIWISLKMKTQITHAKMRETLLRATFFPVMAAVVEDVDEEQPKILWYQFHLLI